MKISIAVTLLAAASTSVAHPVDKNVRDVPVREASSSTCCDFYIKRGLAMSSTCCEDYRKQNAHAAFVVESTVQPEKRDVDGTSAHGLVQDNPNDIIKSRAAQGDFVQEHVQSVDDISGETKNPVEETKDRAKEAKNRAEKAKNHAAKAKNHAAKVKSHAEKAKSGGAKETKNHAEEAGKRAEEVERT